MLQTLVVDTNFGTGDHTSKKPVITTREVLDREGGVGGATLNIKL